MEHFLRLCRDQVTKAIDQFAMLQPGSGCWSPCPGARTPSPSGTSCSSWATRSTASTWASASASTASRSADFARAFAADRDLNLVEVDLRETHGYDIPTGASSARRAPCSVCGISKRHVFDQAALDGGYDVLATGHNLDDEAAVLFGNVLRWETEYLARQQPVLPAREGFPRKVKPLVRLGERETAAYCILRGIDYEVEECPMAVGNKHLGYKEALNAIETTSPGSKQQFYFGYLERAADRFTADDEHGDGVALSACARCGAPTPGEVCAFCRLAERASHTQPVAAPVRKVAS